MTQKTNISVEKLMIITIISVIGGGTALQLGGNLGTLASLHSLLELYCAVFGIVSVAGIILDRQQNKKLTKNTLIKKNNLHALAQRHNQVTDILESNYHAEKSSLGLFDSRLKEQLRQRYELQYLKNKQDFEKKRIRLVSSQNEDNPTTRKFKRFWRTFILVGLLANVAACSYTLGTATELEAKATPQPISSSNLSNGETPLWNAETIPMPHITDGSRYVSNPDKVISNHTEQLLNRMLKTMDDSLQIESSMIIVNHIENQDVFRFAQDIFDRYHVGKNDRGLVVVLAYGDHLIRTHTGRSLEADLTDVECSRLQQTYAIPFMKNEQPDSGILYLAEGLYNTLIKKDLPQTYQQRKEPDADEAFGLVALYILIFAGWAILVAYLKQRYNGPQGKNLLRANPFAKAPVVVVGGGGFGNGRSGGFGGGGGFSGGFSGGSSGGGGATSSW